MSFSTIVSADEVARHLDDPDWVVVDVRFDLMSPAAGREAYERAHVPGAVYADLERDLSDPPGGGRGRHPLPPVEALAGRLGSWGVDETAQVVAYDAGDGMYAARLWWLVRYLGHDAVAVLDGGFAAWVAGGYPTRGGVERREPRRFEARARHEMLATAADVEEARLDPSRRVVDSRAPDRYRGENETIDPVAGHVPGAVNRFFKENLRADGTMRDPQELRRELDAALGGVDASRAIVYCGSGVTACENLLALEHAGMRGARLYAGSWSEWISDPKRPVAKGEEG